MIEKSEEILNSSLSSGSPELIIVFVALGFLKPVIENQNSRLCRRSLDSWVLEIIAGKRAVKEKSSVQARKLSTENNWMHFASRGIELYPRCNLLIKYRYSGISRQGVPSSLQFLKTEIIKP